MLVPILRDRIGHGLVRRHLASPLPAELALVAACCRWPPSPAREEAVREAADRVRDWDALLRTTRRHRVDGLVHDGLRQAGLEPPSAVSSELAAAAARIARANLEFAAESAKLDRLLGDADVPFLFLKGVTLNRLSYDTLALKQAIDIDMVVDLACYEAAIAAVEQAGYCCVQPRDDASHAEILAWVQQNKHSIWAKGRIRLELHTAFVDSAAMLGGVTIHSPRQEVEVASGIVLPTLARDELFAYLAVHGATHGWARIKWLADLAAFVARDGDAAEALYRRSIALGAGRSGGQALLLAHELLGLPVPEPLLAELRGDKAIAYLSRVAVDVMIAAGERELDDMALGTVAIHLSHLRLKRGFAFKLHEVRRKLQSGEHGGSAFAILLAGPRWLARRMRRAATQR
jgi:hypothetical protein